MPDAAPPSARRSLVALPFVAALAVCVPLLLRPRVFLNADSYRAFDWLEAAKFRWYARHAILTEGTPAFWNPYLEGGLPSFAHPSDGTASPFFLVTLLFGEAAGMKIDAVLLLLLGTGGVLLLARDQLRLGPAPAAFAATAFGVAGWTASRLAVGFYESLFLMLVPLALWLVLRAAQWGPNAMGLAYAGGAGVLLAAGGVQMQLCLAFAVLQLALWLPWAAAGEDRGRWLPMVGFAVVAVVLCAGLGAVKFVPMLEFLGARGWRVEALPTAVHGPWTAIDSTLWGMVDLAQPIGEYNARGDTTDREYPYAGLAWSVAALAVVGAVGTGRRGVGAGVLVGITLLLSWIPGQGFQVSLFPLLRSLPVFESMRATDRYVSFFVMLWVCLGAGLGLEVLRSWARIPEARRGLLTALVFASLLPSAAAATKLNHDAFVHRAPHPTAPVETFYQVVTDRFPSRGTQAVALFVYLAPQGGVGVQYPPEDIRPRHDVPLQAAFELHHDGAMEARNDYLGEAWLGRGSGTVGPLRPSVNRLTVAVSTQEPGLVVLNQNHHPAWTCSAGRVVSSEGLLAVELDAAFTGDLELVFRSRAVRLGALISAASAGGFAGLWGLVRRREWLRE